MMKLVENGLMDWIEGCVIDGWMGECIDGQLVGWMEWWMDRWTDILMDGLGNKRFSMDILSVLE